MNNIELQEAMQKDLKIFLNEMLRYTGNYKYQYYGTKAYSLKIIPRIIPSNRFNEDNVDTYLRKYVLEYCAAKALSKSPKFDKIMHQLNYFEKYLNDNIHGFSDNIKAYIIDTRNELENFLKQKKEQIEVKGKKKLFDDILNHSFFTKPSPSAIQRPVMQSPPPKRKFPLTLRRQPQPPPLPARRPIPLFVEMEVLTEDEAKRVEEQFEIREQDLFNKLKEIRMTTNRKIAVFQTFDTHLNLKKYVLKQEDTIDDISLKFNQLNTKGKFLRFIQPYLYVFVDLAIASDKFDKINHSTPEYQHINPIIASNILDYYIYYWCEIILLLGSDNNKFQYMVILLISNALLLYAELFDPYYKGESAFLKRILKAYSVPENKWEGQITNFEFHNGLSDLPTAELILKVIEFSNKNSKRQPRRPRRQVEGEDIF
jgi:hypothetical protein